MTGGAIAAWASVICGLSMMLSELDTAHSDLGVIAFGGVIAFAGGVFICDHGARGRGR